jgi:hypothetical protein
MQYIVNNLSDAFTNYKCVTKYWNHMVNETSQDFSTRAR